MSHFTTTLHLNKMAYFSDLGLNDKYFLLPPWEVALLSVPPTSRFVRPVWHTMCTEATYLKCNIVLGR